MTYEYYYLQFDTSDHKNVHIIICIITNLHVKKEIASILLDNTRLADAIMSKTV